MPRIQTILSMLSQPSQLAERVTEVRMRRAALRYYEEHTTAQTSAERTTFFSRYGNVAGLVDEAKATLIYQRLERETQSDDAAMATTMSQTTSLDDCISMYVMVRALQPRLMVETGVFYGGMSAMILSAMQRNEGGTLYSIDLPIEGDGLPSHLRGGLVTDSLRQNWHLILGNSRVELPRLLTQLGQIDAFNHDSLHTTQHMSWEYETAWPYVKANGVLSSHDVVMTPSWGRFCKRHKTEIRDSGQVYGLGFAIKRS